MFSGKVQLIEAKKSSYSDLSYLFASPHPCGRVEDDPPATLVVGSLQTYQMVSMGWVWLPAHCTHLNNNITTNLTNIMFSPHEDLYPQTFQNICQKILEHQHLGSIWVQTTF